MADTIRCSLSLWTPPQSNLLCSCYSSVPVFTRRKENPMFFHLRSGYDFFPPISDIQKSRYTTSRKTRGFSSLVSQCYVTALKFKTCAADCPLKRAAWFRRRSALYHRLTFKRIALCDFQFSSNSLSGILEYHSSDMAVKISHKLFSMPCGQSIYSSALKIG